MAKAYVEARKRHGDSALLDEIAATKPTIDHKRYHSPEELEQDVLKKIREAAATVESKAAPDELEQYRNFIVDLAERVAEAHKEGLLGMSGERVSEAEQEAIAKVKDAAGASA
jgi:hypothetical protein